MKLGNFVVLAERAREFDTYEEAAAFATHNFPAVICERVRDDADGTVLREVARFDMLYDDDRREWRVMLG